MEAGGLCPPSGPPQAGQAAALKADALPLVGRLRHFVGRNNRQNDQLSLKTARRDDLWLHVQKFHGTHVIIACAGVQPPDGTITEAAELAAYYSEARESQNVPVDVTPVRCLRKPNGAKPGMVVCDRYRTVLVTRMPPSPPPPRGMRNNRNGTLCVPFRCFMIYNLQGHGMPLPYNARPEAAHSFFYFSIFNLLYAVPYR